MRKILVMSDTHGNPETTELALKAHPEADTIVHLGDYTEDLEPWAKHTVGKTLWLAPGKYDRDYEYGILPLVRRAEVEGWQWILVHDRHTVPRKWLEDCNVVFYGHTHIPGCERDENGIVWINPGHLKCPKDRGALASWLWLTVTPEEMFCEWQDEDGIAVREERLQR